MITIEKKEKISRFLRDERMSEAVREVIQTAFLKPQTNKDIYYLAACRVALDLLEDAWRELNRYKESESDKTQSGNNIGL